MTARDVKLSKRLSYILRHDPQSIELTLLGNGWVAIDDLLAKSAAAGKPIGRDALLRVVATSDKKRFTISDDGTMIRAAQGHSVTVELGLTPLTPPELLYHGTASRFLGSIRAEGLLPRSRQQVHLSADEATARTVGARHGSPVVLVVAAGAMHAEGHAFYRADNGVWLTDHVPALFLEP